MQSARVQLIVSSLAASGVLLGLLFRSVEAVLAGAVIHFVMGVADVFRVYREAKALRRDEAAPLPTYEPAIRMSRRLDGAITIVGLILVAVAHRTGADNYAVAGAIIWVGALGCYFISGVIVREVGGIPLSMGYGGWTVRRDKRGRLRR